ncbi:PadR family transcriptional regulator [Sphaerisporangium siamense]|uniref:DNA-binding PadR family transcriptional regulator n=1 Tax=Sphaerisporangium siamense TaxID=795645 RepID=A0A7W7DCA5_9ACTN|nr:PadR family transcriptional regulator [Sphaerisporangium siamense]MBB4703041.1 DNA-binding PadR family transcriptional regulator [Sphaerisporangium siamense]
MSAHPPPPPFTPPPAGPVPPVPPIPPAPPAPPVPPVPPGFHHGPPGAHFAPRVRRGDVRAALLSLLAEGERNGYQMIQEIQRRSHGIWRPSPGSVYPALQQLEDERLITGEESGGSRTYRLTGKGRDHLARHAAGDPWSEVASSLPEEMMELRMLWSQLGEAFAQLTQVANPRQLAAARTLLKSTRRSIFVILADDGDEEEEEP